MPADGGIRFGQYVLLRRLARGGMAEVFLAQQRGLEGFDRRVAVKRILPHLADTPDFVKMFLGEAKLAAQLAHPNVVHIYDFGKVDNDYFIAMEFVDGVHAGDLFKQGAGERLPPTLVARLGADAAAALNYAHELHGTNGKPLGLVHRDVSPANLMVSYDGIVKLCDFGIAKAASAGNQLTNPGQVKGKYAYMSPEQTVAAPLDGRSDVFSLSIVLWELLAGRTIVPRGDAIDAMRAIRDGKLAPLSQVAPATPPTLAKAIMWGLETRREQRATAAELAVALEAFIKASPEIASSMQLAAWVRNRFPRDPAGPQSPGGPGTSAGGGTLGGGTLGGGTLGGGTAPGTLASVVTPPRLIAASRVVHDTEDTEFDELDLAETRMRDDRFADRASQPTVVDDRPRPPDDDLDAPTLKPGQRPVGRVGGPAPPPLPRRPPTLPAPDARARKAAAADETVLPPPSIIVGDTLSDANETASRSGAQRLPMPNPGAIPTLAVAPLTTYPHHALVIAPTLALRTPPSRGAVFAVLGAVTLLTFVLALASRACSPGAAPPSDAPPIDARPLDAMESSDGLVAPSDAAEAVVDAAFQPTIPADAPGPATTLLEVHTRPDGASIKIGDQMRRSPARFALPAGHHTVIAELRGYEPERREVDLLATEHLTQEIQFTKKLVVYRPVPVTLGKLTIRTTPYSEVFHGSKKIGEAPFADLVLPAGSYTLTFKNPTRPPMTKKITITAGKTTKLGFALPL